MVVLYFKNRESKKAIMGDTLASHISTKVIEECKKKNIMFILLSPNSTHLCQPLNISYFTPVNPAWRPVLEEWKMSSRGCIPKTNFSSCYEVRWKIFKTKAARIYEVVLKLAVFFVLIGMKC